MSDDVVMTDDGFRRVEDMTREELLHLVERQAVDLKRVTDWARQRWAEAARVHASRGDWSK